MDIIKRVAPAAALLIALLAIQAPAAQSPTLESTYYPVVPTGKIVSKQVTTIKNKPIKKQCKNSVVGWLRSAGFKGQSVRIGWAIVMRESRGQNLVPGNMHFNGYDYGPWQINRPAHPDYSAGELSDPISNNKIAFKLSKGGTDWRPWGIGVTESGKVYLDSTAYNGIWSEDKQYAWIWEPFIYWYERFPANCR